jgi:hypothetical protein
MRTGVLVVAALIAVPIVWWLLRFVLGFFFGMLHMLTGLLYLALFLGLCIFVIGLVRRLVRS